MSKAQRGNILFLILLAVVLFAALSYAVTSSTQGGGKSGSSESMAALAASWIQQTALLESAIARLKMVGDCTDAQIQFSDVQTYANTFSPVDKHCHVFDKAGGGLEWLYIPEEIKNAASPWVLYQGVGKVKNVGTDDYDLVMVARVNQPFCDAVNKGLGLDIANNREMMESGVKTPFNGYYGVDAGNTQYNLGDETAQYALPSGLREACFARYSSASLNGFLNEYWYYKVLIAR